MARPKSSEKRAAILRAAVHEIAKAGLGAPTAKVARRTGIADTIERIRSDHARNAHESSHATPLHWSKRFTRGPLLDLEVGLFCFQKRECVL